MTAFCLALCIPPNSATAHDGHVSLSLGTPAGHMLPDVQRGLFEAFFDGKLGYESYQRSLGTLSGPWPGSGLALSLSYERPSLGEAFHYRFGLEFGKSSGRFPDGIGIFSDPAKLQLRYTSISGEIDLLHDRRLLSKPDLRATVAAGAVGSLAWARLSSALLDVQSTTTTLTPYLRLEFESQLEWGSPILRLYSQITSYPDGGTFLAFGARGQF